MGCKWRFRLAFVVLSVGVVAICGCGQSRDEVIQWIESQGGRVICDSAHEDQPVVKVTLTARKVNDVSPLAHLPHLQELSLRGCQVSDMSPLSGLRNLKKLDIGDTQVSDLRPIAEIESLQVLDLNGTPVEAVDPLQEMPALRQVVLTNSNVNPRRAIVLQGQMLNCNVSW